MFLNKVVTLLGKLKNYRVLLAVLLFTIILFINVYWLYISKSSLTAQILQKDQTIQQQLTEISQVSLANSNLALKNLTQILPGLEFPVLRFATKTSYPGWKEYKHKSGYKFYYPPKWDVEDNTVRNWKNIDGRFGAMGQDDAKWDLSFNEIEVKSLPEAIDKAVTGIDSYSYVEVSKTLEDLPLYFALKPSDEEEYVGEAAWSYIIAVIKTEKNKAIIWRGYAGRDPSPNTEILKQIAESIH